MSRNFTRFAFTDSVKRLQERHGTRRSYARLEQSEDRYRLTAREASFIQSRDGFYMASVGENGWPYVQFRGGDPGFLKVVDDTTLAYADFRGNGQYISSGNMNANGKVALILMDYPERQRLKVWARASFVEADSDPDLLHALRAPDYPGDIERLVTLEVQAYDWNCPRHITPRYTLEEIQALTDRDPSPDPRG